MIKTKLIKNNSLLTVFRDKYATLAHNQVDLEYFKNSKVRIFFSDSEENIVAGYCICSGPNYRTLLPLSPAKLEEISQKNGFKDQPPHEITCLWIEEKQRKSAWVIYFFLILSLDILRLPKGALIFGTHGKNINNYFCLAFPKLIFYDRLFVATKGEVCDFWLRKGSKFHFFKAFIVLSAVRSFFGNKSLARFRLWLDKRDKAKWGKQEV
ncbi:Uncharacterised protein [Legionella busanensis]|uniref:Uncharacterized protein n=1 Tax=Legionella busanensis TaxID=190655 RepID=A0A378JMP6_9GAMM|nr:hypothetical protein [Legionella busanensis]STX52515.1 Uncharacterised protein [Legionella busanensis]